MAVVALLPKDSPLLRARSWFRLCSKVKGQRLLGGFGRAKENGIPFFSYNFQKRVLNKKEETKFFIRNKSPMENTVVSLRGAEI